MCFRAAEPPLAQNLSETRRVYLKDFTFRASHLAAQRLGVFRTESSRFEVVSVKGQPLLSQTPIFELELRKIHIAIMTAKQKGSGSSGRCEVPTMRTIIFEVYVLIVTPINGNPISGQAQSANPSMGPDLQFPR